MIFNHTPWNWHTRYCRTGIPSAVSRVDNVQSCQDISHHGTLKNGPKHDGITILKNQDVRVIHVEIQMLPHVDYSPCICIYIIIILSHNLFPTVFPNDLFPMIMIIQYYPIIFPIYIYPIIFVYPYDYPMNIPGSSAPDGCGVTSHPNLAPLARL